MNKYTSLLQTTSYLFEETETTPRTCVGVVKPHIVYEKSPCQDMADLNMLQKKEEFSHVFSCEDAKKIWLIMVDELGIRAQYTKIAFLRAEKHLRESHYFTSITTRHSGGSYLNPVELMNGCLALAHSNMFIPSTLGGPVYAENGMNQDQLKINLNLAADVYISRVNNAPCGGAKIQLHKVRACDDEATSLLNRRDVLLTFLNGKPDEKMALKHRQPELYGQFEEVWKVLSNHCRKDVPRKYGLVLQLCFKPDCCILFANMIEHPKRRCGLQVAHPSTPIISSTSHPRF